MRINSPGFGSLSVAVDRSLLNLPNIKKQVNRMTKLFRDRGFDKKKNVDVVLNYNEQNGFFAFIKDKKTGKVPFSYASEHKISFKPKDIKDFSIWLDEIDYSHSKRGKKEWTDLNRTVLDYITGIKREAKKTVKRHKEADKLKESLLI